MSTTPQATFDVDEFSATEVCTKSNSIAGAIATKHGIGANAFSLVCMFQVLTACCIFFAILKTSALLAVLGTLITTPAIIRTSIAADLHQKAGYRFSWAKRIKCFLESTGLTVVTFAIAAIVFALINLCFGLACLGVSFVLGVDEMSTDIAFVGTVGGMVWGAAGAILAFAFCMRKWQMKIGPAV